MKIIKIRQNQNKQAFFTLLKREVEAIGRIEHVSRLPPRRQLNTLWRDSLKADTLNSLSSLTIYAQKLV